MSDKDKVEQLSRAVVILAETLKKVLPKASLTISEKTQVLIDLGRADAFTDCIKS